MEKKAKKTLVISSLVLVFLLVSAGILFFLYQGDKGGIDVIDSTSEDGAATLTATFYDFSGTQPQGGVVQSLIGGTAKQTHVAFSLKASNTGSVALTQVIPVNPNANMGAAFSNAVPLATLAIGATNIPLASSNQSCTATANCNTNEDCCKVGTGCGSVGAGGQCLIKLDPLASANAGVANNVVFSVSIRGNYSDALGAQLQTTSSPVSLTYDIRGEKCSDGTTINTCVFARTSVDADKPDYCSFVEGSAPTIINKATVCGCPAGQGPSGENCVALTCSDGSTINSFSTATGSFGGFNLQGGFATGSSATNNTRVYCTASQVLQMQCNNAKTTLGSGVLTNELACKKDALGRYAASCNPTTGEPSVCVYSPVSAGLTGSLSEGA